MACNYRCDLELKNRAILLLSYGKTMTGKTSNVPAPKAKGCDDNAIFPSTRHTIDRHRDIDTVKVPLSGRKICYHSMIAALEFYAAIAQGKKDPGQSQTGNGSPIS